MFTLGKHVVRLVVVVLLVSLETLWFISLLPGSEAAALAGQQDQQPAVINAITKEFSLNEGFFAQYSHWIGNLATGNLGRSPLTQVTVVSALKQRIPVTFELALLALIVALLIAVPVAVYASYRQGKLVDKCAMATSSAFLSIPPFLAAILLTFLFAVTFKILPVYGWVPITQSLGQNLDHAVLPVLALALPLAAIFTRLLRNDMAATLQEDYILAARTRGIGDRKVLFGHALRPSAVSLVTVAGLSLAQLLGGAVIVENIFALPGMGTLAVQSIVERDYITLRGIVVVAAIAYVVVNAVIDILYPLLDPRARQGAKS